jgi:hypothetical protein
MHQKHSDADREDHYRANPLHERRRDLALQIAPYQRPAQQHDCDRKADLQQANKSTIECGAGQMLSGTEMVGRQESLAVTGHQGMNEPEQQPGSKNERNVRRVERVTGLKPGDYAFIQSMLEIDDGVHEPIFRPDPEKLALALVYS